MSKQDDKYLDNVEDNNLGGETEQTPSATVDRSNSRTPRRLLRKRL